MWLELVQNQPTVQANIIDVYFRLSIQRHPHIPYPYPTHITNKLTHLITPTPTPTATATPSPAGSGRSGMEPMTVLLRKNLCR